MTLEKDLELVGVPLQHPALASGAVTAVQSGPIIQWTPSFTDTAFGSALVSGSEYYAEVVGPTAHPWLGHRFELNEPATQTRTDHALVPVASPWNTKGPINSSLLGATIEVRPHLTLPYLVDDTLLRRIQSGGENPKSFQFFLPFPGLTSLSAQLSLSGNTMLWQQSTSARPLRSEELILPPGSSFGLKFGERRGLSRGFTGVVRKVPCPCSASEGDQLHFLSVRQRSSTWSGLGHPCQWTSGRDRWPCYASRQNYPSKWKYESDVWPQSNQTGIPVVTGQFTHLPLEYSSAGARENSRRRRFYTRKNCC